MNILFLTQWFDPEPGAIHGMPLATWMADRGHRVQVVTGFPNYPTGKFYPGYKLRVRQREHTSGVDILRVPLYPSHDSSPVRRAMNYGSFALSSATIGTWSTGKADVAYVYHPPPTVSVAPLLWSRTRQLPFVYHIADMWPDSVTQSGMIASDRVSSIVDRAISWWCDRTYRGAAAITVLSPGFKELLVQRGVPADKVHVIYNWANEAHFTPHEPDPTLASRFGMAGRFNVVYAGNLGPFQNLDVAIRAAAMVADLPDFQLVIAGTGQEESRLRELTSEERIDNVRFVGRLDYTEMSRVNAIADALLVSLKDLPFFHATIPSKTQVALASGRPVVMAVGGDAARLVERAEAGMTCAPADAAGLADVFRRMYHSDQSMRDTMGANGRAYYERELSLDAGASALEGLLQRVVDARSTRIDVGSR